MFICFATALLAAVNAFYKAAAECFIVWCATKLFWNIFSTREYCIVLAVLWVVNFIISCFKIARLFRE